MEELNPNSIKFIFIPAVILFLVCSLFISGVKVGENLVCKNSNGFVINGSCIVPRSNLDICTIDGKPYFVTPDFDLQVMPKIEVNVSWP